jgi:hypothetical protein
MSDDDPWEVDPAGPVPVVWAFAQAVLVDRDLRSAWLMMDDNLRLAMAQRFLYGTLGPQAIADLDKRALAQEDAEALAAGNFDHPLWAMFEDGWSSELDRVWPERIDISQWATTTAPRPIGPGLEHVLFLETGGEQIVLQPGEMIAADPSVNFLLRNADEGWKIASTSTQLPEPGWPPVWRDTDAGSP